MGPGTRSASRTQRFGRVLRNGRWAIVAGIAATMIPALLITLMQDRPYRAEADMVLRTLPTDIAPDAGAGATDPVRRLQNEIAVLEGTEVADRLRADQGLSGDVPAVDGFASGAADVITARVEATGAELASSLANGYVDAYIAVQSDRLAQSYVDSIAELETQIAALQAQYAALPAGDPQQSAILEQQQQLEDRVDLLTVDLAVAQAPAELIRPAAVPSSPVAPTLWPTALLSFVIGLALGIIGAILMRTRPHDVRTAADLTGLRATEPLLAVVPAEGSPNNKPIVARQSVGSIVDAYTDLRTVVQRIIADRNIKVIQCCSPHDGDGATTTAVNLAVILARTGAKVALVDLDLCHPRVHEMLGLDLVPGVTDALNEDRDDTDGINALTRLDLFDRIESDDPSAELDRVLPVGGAALTADADPGWGPPSLVTDDSGPIERLALEAVDVGPPPVFMPIAYYDDLTVITAGTTPNIALPVLSRTRLDDLMRQLRDSHDVVLVDSPAVLEGGEAAAIARHADGAVMVVRAGTVPLSVVRQALGAVDRAGTRILGLVLTGSSS